MPETMPDGSAWPRISIVTPSYNQGRFLEETIRSVLLQGYPNLEYIVIDGGSTDESVEIIRKYEPWLAYWVSQKDGGQSDAVNNGLRIASGHVLNWLNADDLLLPSALKAIGMLFAAAPDVHWVTGARITRQMEDGTQQVQMPWVENWPYYTIDLPDFPQEATFFTADAWRAIGGLKVELHNAMDVLFFHQMLCFSKRGILANAPISCMGIHADQKTHAHVQRRAREYETILQTNLLERLSRRIVFRLMRTRLHPWVWGVLRLTTYAAARRTFRRGRFDRIQQQWVVDPF